MNKSCLISLLLSAVACVSANLNFDVREQGTVSYNSGTENEVRSVAQIKLVKSSNAYHLSTRIYERTSTTQSLISENQLADLGVSSYDTTQLASAVKAAGAITLNLQVNALANPLASGGYKVACQILSPQQNLKFLSDDYLKFQSSAITDDQSKLMFFDLFLLNTTTSIRNWSTGEGATLLSDTWNSDEIMKINNSFGSTKMQSKTFQISIPYSFANQLPQGTYSFQVLLAMDSYQMETLSEKITNYREITDRQVAFFESLINSILGAQDNTNNVLRLTASGKATLKSNLIATVNRYQVFLNDVTKQCQVYLSDPNITTSEISALTSKISSMSQKKKQITALIAG